jgi:hypothetical protein
MEPSFKRLIVGIILGLAEKLLNRPPGVAHIFGGRRFGRGRPGEGSHVAQEAGQISAQTSETPALLPRLADNAVAACGGGYLTWRRSWHQQLLFGR